MDSFIEVGPDPGIEVFQFFRVFFLHFACFFFLVQHSILLYESRIQKKIDSETATKHNTSICV